MENWEQSILPAERTIEEGIDCLNLSQTRIILVCDDRRRLKGVVTDSDIRRAMMSRLDLSTPICDIMKSVPVVAFEHDRDQKIIQIMKSASVFQLPVLNTLGQVCGLKLLNELIPAPKIENMVILMAGGLGTRLHPLTLDIPKPLAPVGGKPIIEILLDTLDDSGFSDIQIAINYKGEQIREALSNRKSSQRISFIEERLRMGTAGALSLLPETPSRPFFVLNADIVTTLDYKSMLSFHEINDFDITVAVRRENVQIPFGVVTIDDDRITSFKEKPNHYYFANVGIYVISPHLIHAIPKDRYFDMSSLIQYCLENELSVGSFPMHEYWTDIGHPAQLAQAQKDIAQFNLGAASEKMRS